MIYKYEMNYAKKGGGYDDKHTIAEIMADDILEADELLKELCGVDPKKAPMLIVSIIKYFSFDPFFAFDFEAGTAIV